MFLSPIDEAELLSDMRKLKQGKAAGMDGVPPDLIKQSCELIVRPLTHIFNSSFQNGVVPDQFKLAKTVPIYKKASKLDVGNYRPISLLSIFNKLLERLMHKRLYGYLTRSQLLNDYQFGFRRNHSTILALIEITDRIRDELDSGNTGLAIYLDLSKAFDLVNHKILLHKAKHLGIRGPPQHWLSSYLSERKQQTVVDGVISDSLDLPIGVPQGSILGPLLFLIYVNDIAISLDHTSLRLFADDTNVFIFHKDPTQLHGIATNALDQLLQWFSHNHLLLNLKKTCFSIFSKRNIDVNSLTVGSATIHRVECTKYLGLELDCQLSWKTHIDSLVKKLRKIQFVFKSLSPYIKDMQVRQLYYAYAHPHIMYAASIFGTCSASLCGKLQVAQNDVLRTLCKVPRFNSGSELRKKYKIPSVNSIIKSQTLIFVFKQVNKMLPKVFSNFFA